MLQEYLERFLALPGLGCGGAAQELQNWGRTSLGFGPGA